MMSSRLGSLILILAAALPVRAADSPFKTAGDPNPDCAQDFLLTEYYAGPNASTKGIFSWWHPVEIELVRGMKRPDDYTDFSAPLKAQVLDGKSDINVKLGVLRKLEESKAADADKDKSASDFAQNTLRPKMLAAAKAMPPSKGASDQFSGFEAPFLRCRMRYVGRDDAFAALTQTAVASNKTAEFVAYWRGFVRGEISIYAAEGAALGAAKPDSKKLYAAFVERTRKALGTSPGATSPAAETKPPIKDDFRDGLVKVPPDAPTSLTQHEYDLLWHGDARHPEEQAQYVARLKKALALAPTGATDAQALESQKAIKAVVSEYRAQVVTRDPDTNLSLEELATFGANSKKVYDEIKGLSGDARKAKVTEYRAQIAKLDPAMNLKPEELAAFGPQAATSKQAEIDALSGDARKAKVAQLRQIAQRWQARSGSSGGSTIPLDQLKAAEAANGDLSALDQIFNGNRSGGDAVDGLTGPGGGKTAQQISDELNKKPNDQPPTKATNSEPPKPGEDKVASSDDGGKTWKKDVPNLASGARWGIFAMALGMFFAGGAGVLLFGVVGFMAGYGLSKVQKSLGD